MRDSLKELRKSISDPVYYFRWDHVLEISNTLPHHKRMDFEGKLSTLSSVMSYF